MAGGMTPGGEHGTILERVQATSANEAARAAGGHSTADLHGKRPADWADVLRDRRANNEQATPPPIKHCWYDGPHGPQAALLLEWRGGDGHYDGRIAVATLEPDGWAIIEMWVEQGLLRPA